MRDENWGKVLKFMGSKNTSPWKLDLAQDLKEELARQRLETE